VATCTTSLQPKRQPNEKKRFLTQTLGSCCYKFLCTQQLNKKQTKTKKANLLQTKCYITAQEKSLQLLDVRKLFKRGNARYQT
jgi:hypothetical protein